MEEQTRQIWKSHFAIENIIVKGTKLIVKVYDTDEAKYCLDHLKDDLLTINDFLVNNDFPEFNLVVDLVDRNILP